MSGFRFFSKKKTPGSRVREARYAGSWYNDDAPKLDQQLDEFLQAASGALSRRAAHAQFQEPKLNLLKAEGNVLAIVSPHAGYMFSGQTAAYAFSRAQMQEKQGQKVKRVFLLGPSHYAGFEGAALSDAGAFETPLGNLPIDLKTVEALGDFPLFRFMPEVHRKEHSLELQLPLIYKTFGPIELVPIVIGQLEDEMETRLIGGVLKRFLKEDDLVVVSTDFCHIGPRYQYQPFTENIKDNVYRLDKEAYTYISSLDLEGFINFRERTGATICGFYPLCVLLSILPESTGSTVLNYATSQDSLVEDDENSVSYMAIAVGEQEGKECHWNSGSEQPADDVSLSAEERKALLLVARETIAAVSSKKPQPNTSELKKTHRRFAAPRGVFVTLFKKTGDLSPDNRRELRGCIGHIWPVRSLVDAVCENAAGAAMRDYRFLPVTADELDSLEIEISVLTPLKRIESYDEIVIGRDGVVLYKNGSQAVFLPHVAAQFGWNLEQTLTQLSLKAGLGETAWKQGAKFDIFQTESFEEHENGHEDTGDAIHS
ncbi:MAG TPA: AmmeMemoRadiSam system protein B [Candidatus Melainabacteria bacterium]|nr:AmmeMemoRadiSam system protein B [Candidatus Melainabacteria bacterium]HIN64626.1 AmmeMemoRadiSam system protein B [Candidatus Obscuribacterales bacterium]